MIEAIIILFGLVGVYWIMRPLRRAAEVLEFQAEAEVIEKIRRQRLHRQRRRWQTENRISRTRA